MAQVETNQKFTLTASPQGRGGRTAKIKAGSAEWASSDESVATLAINPDDELSVAVTSDPTNEGECLITCKAKQDLEGEPDLIGTFALVVNNTALALDMNAGPTSDV